MASKPEDRERAVAGDGRRARIEIRVAVLFVAAIIVLGGAWVVLMGSPTQHRAAIDSPNNPQPTLEPKAR